MEFFRKHEKVWKIITAVAIIAIIVASFLPYLTLLSR